VCVSSNGSDPRRQPRKAISARTDLSFDGVWSPGSDGPHTKRTGEAGKTLRVLTPQASVDLPAAQHAVRNLLLALGFDLSDEGLVETPRRVATALAELVTPLPFKMTTFANTERYDQLVLARAIPFHSLCQHHLLPIVGVAHVGYVPADRIVGLSKLARVVDHFARGLQVQERLTTQIANCLRDGLKAKGVGVVLEAEHMCMSLRGVQKPGTKTVTSTLLGTIRHNARAREEFLGLARVQGRHRVTPRATRLVSRRESFNAAHQLCDPDLSEEENRRVFGKCANLHGHNYMLEAVVTGAVDPSTGYVMDLKRLSDLVCREIIRHVDHRNLNTDVPWLAGLIPTAENLAAAFWDRLEPHLPGGALHSVRIWETEKNWAEYRGDG
jgi:GTP cyclohydrolase IA